MIRYRRTVAWCAAAFAVGALAWAALGGRPHGEAVSARQDEAWTSPLPARASLAATDAVWEKRHPWGAPPSDPASQAPELVAIPVGTTATSGKLLAVFLAPDGSVLRLGRGDAIAGGGHVDAVTQFHVSWTDAHGTKHEQELLADPLPTQASSP
jgi:hypothetical protein